MKKKTKSIQEPLFEEPVQEEKSENLVGIIDDVNVGVLLKKARIKKKKDIQKIADKLCIRTCYLQALEESEYEAFPGRTYAFGFLRTYADFLGLDVEALIEQYRKETSGIKNEEREMPIIEQTDFFPKIKYLFWAGLVIILMWSFWYFLTYSETPEVLVSPEENALVIEKVEVLPATLEQEIVSNIVDEKPLPEKIQEKQQSAVENSVQILAREDVWIEIEQDDMLVFSRTLKKGEVYDVPKSDKEMFLKTGNAGGMDILVDGKKVKSFGPVGSVRSGISLFPENLKKH